MEPISHVHNKILLDFQAACNKADLRVGDIITCQKTNKVTAAGQKMFMKGSPYAKATHMALVYSIDENGINLFESVNRKNQQGVYIMHYSPMEFKEYIGKGMHVLRNKKLKDEIEQTTESFAEKYAEKKIKTGYSFKHIGSLSTSSYKDTRKGRARTFNSFEKSQLMTSKGEEREKAICSELVAEIVKIAEFKHAVKDQKEVATLKLLREYQKKGVVLDVSSEHVSVGRLEKELVRHGFESHNLRKEEFLLEQEDDA